MKSGKNKWLTTMLEISLYIILVTGVVFILAICDLTAPKFDGGVIILAMLHKILGFIFIGLVLWHALTWKKWYQVWLRGKLKNKKSLLTKSISILFILFTIFLFFEHTLPHKVFIWGHVITGTIWILLIMKHVSTKRQIT